MSFEIGRSTENFDCKRRRLVTVLHLQGDEQSILNSIIDVKNNKIDAVLELKVDLQKYVVHIDVIQKFVSKMFTNKSHYSYEFVIRPAGNSV